MERDDLDPEKHPENIPTIITGEGEVIPLSGANFQRKEDARMNDWDDPLETLDKNKPLSTAFALGLLIMIWFSGILVGAFIAHVFW